MKLLRQYSSTMHGNYKKASLGYGIVMGIVMSLILLVRYLIYMPAKAPITTIDEIALLVLMAIATIIYKNGLKDKRITFKEAYMIAFLSAIVCVIIYGIFMYIYTVGIDKDFQNHCIETLRKNPKYIKYTPSQMKEMVKVSNIVMQSIVSNLVMSVLWAMVVGVIFRNEKSEIINRNKLK
ncbi:MAG: DUF4199 domain-containing protein [Bacteroidales bacterium]|jgi:Mg/Co/Ni transporter MgtE|nr:DUF4199 domain-containing protein [Bacteroidales bacterium]